MRSQQPLFAGVHACSARFFVERFLFLCSGTTCRTYELPFCSEREMCAGPAVCVCVCVCVCVMNVGARWMVESEGLDRTRVNKNRKSPPLQPSLSVQRPVLRSALSRSPSLASLSPGPAVVRRLSHMARPAHDPTVSLSEHISFGAAGRARTSLDSRFSCRSDRLSNTDSFSSHSILLILLILLAVLAIILIPAARGKPSRATLQLPGREGARARPISGDL